MPDQPSEAQQQQAVQIMTTEHFTLQTARGATISETNGRASLFISTVSSALVALAFIGQVSNVGLPFFAFGLVLFPTLLFLGVVTFVRVLQSSVEDTIYARGINRIRHFYAEQNPQIKHYFILSTHDDGEGILWNMGAKPSAWQPFLTNAGMILVINSVLAGVTAGFATNLAGLRLAWSVGAGVLVLLVSLVLHQRYQSTTWQQIDRQLPVLFPSDAGEARS